jgi:hypothetical protein
MANGDVSVGLLSQEALVFLVAIENVSVSMNMTVFGVAADLAT